ncbi:MAG: hypothetical protein HY429_02100 [Candidatus Levybacteria bacterium]|nr:hypothetical protein [Candidatus Levybacteria bacterium]
MRRKKRSFWLFVIGLLTLACLFYLIIVFPPDWKFAISGVEGLKLEIVFVFFLFFSTSLFSLITFAFNSKQQGVLVSTLVTTYLFLRFIGLTQILFLLLLVAIALILELVFSKQY